METVSETYGEPLQLPGLATAPINEAGVVYLFGIIAWRLGFQVDAMRTAFPDCEARRRVCRGKWHRVTIEFEYESRNYLHHSHPVNGCDIIVCWERNWADCPKNLEIIALKDKLARLTSLGTVPATPSA